MNCERYQDGIQELIDGTLGALRRAELEQHLEVCADCRALLDDLQRIHDTGASLDRLAPPDRVWLQIAGRLRLEGRVKAPPVTRAVSSNRRAVLLALAAALVLAVGASLYFLVPRGQPAPTQTSGGPAAPGNAAQDDPVQSIEAEFRLAEQHYQNAIARLEEAAKSGSTDIDPQTAAMLQKNLKVIDQAIAESRAALTSEPQSVPARDTLFEALRRKVTVLQNTIALMNEMRKGDAAGAAQVADSIGKS